MKEVSKSPNKISNMFNEIANVYDRNNDIISLGLHRIVKKFAIEEFNPNYNEIVVDLCCGTGDICGYLLKYVKSNNIIGVDFSSEMLNIARHKYPSLKFIQADISDVPQETSRIDKITICFGLRNVENRDQVIAEMHRILKPDGEILHIDFGNKNCFSKIFDLIVLLLIKLFRKNAESYEYLIHSKSQFPVPKELIEEFKKANFELKKCKNFIFGVVSMQIYKKI